MKGKETGYAPRASRETRISRPLFKLNLHDSAPGARPARSAPPLATAAFPAVQPDASCRPFSLPTGPPPPGAAAICIPRADWLRGRVWGFPLRGAGIPVRRLLTLTAAAAPAATCSPEGRGLGRPRPLRVPPRSLRQCRARRAGRRHGEPVLESAVRWKLARLLLSRTSGNGPRFPRG